MDCINLSENLECRDRRLLVTSTQSVLRRVEIEAILVSMAVFVVETANVKPWISVLRQSRADMIVVSFGTSAEKWRMHSFHY
jgi:hypothetical protein